MKEGDQRTEKSTEKLMHQLRWTVMSAGGGNGHEREKWNPNHIKNKVTSTKSQTFYGAFVGCTS